jgi:hypothetical protein
MRSRGFIRVESVKAFLNWIALLMTGAALGLALAAFQTTFDIPAPVMQIGIAVTTAVVLAAAFWTAWRYWREVAKEDE